MKKHTKKYFMLIEALVYIAVLAMLLALSYQVFYKSLTGTRLLGRAGDDIVKVSQIGDKWRDEIRGAESVNYKDGILSISKKDGEAFYSMKDGTLQYRVKDGKWRTLYDRIVKCEFSEPPQDGFTAWEMLVELKSDRKKAKVRPLFSFTAVNLKGHTDH